jgi:hypothetical protein
VDDVVDLSVALLRRFAEFTKKLTPEQLAGVASGELKFGLLDAPTRNVPVRKPKPDPLGGDAADSIRTDLHALNSRKAAADYVDGLRLSADGLRALARSLGASLSGVSKKDEFRDRIVEHTVGYRLNSGAFSG